MSVINAVISILFSTNHVSINSYCKQVKLYYIQCRTCSTCIKKIKKVYCSSPPVAEALSFTITRPISSPSWIIFHSHYQSSIFCSIVTRAHFKTCAGLRVLAPWRACQAQSFHSSWFSGWAHFCFAARRDYRITSILMFIHKTMSKSPEVVRWLLTEKLNILMTLMRASITSLCPSHCVQLPIDRKLDQTRGQEEELLPDTDDKKHAGQSCCIFAKVSLCCKRSTFSLNAAQFNPCKELCLLQCISF